MSHTLDKPPSFSQLMREVREEENWISAREGVKATVTAATATVPQSSVTSELNSLRNEVRELTSQVARLLSAVPVTPTSESTTARTGSVQQAPEATVRDASPRV